MKTKIVLLGFALSAATAFSQDPTIVEYGPLTNQMTVDNHNQLMNTLNQLLSKADSQLKDLDNQLKQIGDYKAAATSGPATDEAAIVKASLDAAAAGGLKTNADLKASRDDNSNKDIFNSDLDGAMTKIGDTYKDKAGNTKQRDVSNYKVENDLNVRIKEYNRVRDQAIQDQARLQQALMEALDALEKATDQATIDTQSALIQTIEGQIQASQNTVLNANNDVIIREKEIANQRQIEAKSRMEGRTGGVQAALDALHLRPKGTATGSTDSGRLPWGGN